jgi:zinc protease
LENGAVVLLKESHAAPLISWWVFYRVGSKDEHTGQTGISHWVEHMMFKGTEAFPAGMLDKEIDRLGGMWNAQTSYDYTAYYETLPAEKIEIALRAEADRMVNAKFDPAETESERTVIISERQGSENQPSFWLGEAVQATAFHVHPYGHSIIGDMADLQTMTRDDLYEHYLGYYSPNNAILVAVGDFDSAQMLAKINEVYGSLPPRPEPRRVIRPEPPQQGERQVNVQRPGSTQFLEILYRAPAVNDPDWFAFAALDSVLGGPSGPGGGGIDNKTSRIYKALVESGIAVEASSYLSMSKDPLGYYISLVLPNQTRFEAAEAAVDELLQGVLTHDPITAEELAKAQKQAKAAFVYATESVTGQARWLGYAEMLGDYALYTDYVNKLAAVSLGEVQAVAKKYLRPEQRTVGRFIPLREGQDA